MFKILLICMLSVIGFSIESYRLHTGIVGTSHFLFCAFYFSWLLAPAKTCSTILYRCGEKGQPFLIPDVSGNVFGFMFAV